MDDQRRKRLGLLLEQVLTLPPDERPQFLEGACGGDATLLAELTSLLDASESSADYFEQLAERVVLPSILAAAGESRSGTRDDARQDAIPAGTVLSHYEILERIGGGMGVVYRACDLELGRTVALKFLPPLLAADARARERLSAEARAISALDHPHIGTVYEIGEAEGHGLFIALAWNEGETLKQKLERGPLPVAEVVDLARQMTSALAAAHVAGIVHRDVKPSNIICTAQGTAKLVDFGIAKRAGEDLTREGATPGTVAYMSPERTRGDANDARTDLWSLGVVLYEMLAGRRPFRGESDAILIHAIRHDEAVALDHLRPDVPPALAAIVERCLAKDPAQRYASAEELLEVLDDVGFVAHATQGSHDPAPRRPRSRLRTAAALVALPLVVGIGYLLRTDGTVIENDHPSGVVPADGRTALAVLPFENRSGQPADQHFTDGLHDEIRDRLAGVSALRVTSRTSVVPYRDSPKNVRDIAAELGVDHIMEGAVQRAGDSVRISVRLIDAGSDVQIWSQNFATDLDVRRIFAVQAEIAGNVAEALRVELTQAERLRIARRPPTDPIAWQHYQQGRRHWNRRTVEGLDSAFRHFRSALDQDPLYAEAYAGLANVHVLPYGPAGTAGPALAIEAARSALRLDTTLAEAHTALGFALATVEQNWQTADRAFRRAIELNHNYATAYQWYAELLASQGQLDSAIVMVRIAEDLDPNSAIIGWSVARILGFARRRDEELAQLQALAGVFPRDDRVITSLVAALSGHGRYDEAANVMQTFLRPMMQEVGTERAVRFRSIVDGLRTGRGDMLLEFFREEQPAGTAGEGHQGAFDALALALAGDMEAAITTIQAVREQNAFGAGYSDLAVGSHLDIFRDDPRFQSILRGMNLDPSLGLELRDRDPFWRPPR